MPNEPERTGKETGGVSRRGFLGLVGAGAAAAAAGGAGYGIGAARAQAASGAKTVHPFYGTHQAGITTEVQQHLYFASLDLTDSTTRDDLIELLKAWTDASARLTHGQQVTAEGAVGGGPLKPPDDTGEALGLGPAALTITFGFGPSLFTGELGKRLSIADRKPDALADLPLFAFDILEDELSGGDLCIQACAEDPQVAVHAIRNLTRLAFGKAMIRWAQLGYGKTSATSKKQATPRNLFGFKDGTANIMANETADLEAWVWTDADSQPAWFAGGTYLVVRKILMTIESWDRAQLGEQEQIIGRDKFEGAPLSGGEEFTDPDFGAVEADGAFAIPADSHVRLAHPDNNGGVRILRRGFNFVEGNNNLGQLTAGLFFIAFQKDPQQFIDVQRSLKSDALNEYIRHVGSAVFAVPPGVREGGYIGQGLFE
ncbi:iron uptake transporter deferrochelatase/peroxidase subunit [Rarobacter incanus]|uniref:Deferrochelatase n=1 Tax=Rarobacter incanus TaxID=153494 RepID=A0A542SPR1_9MICO|nr:iron uptake transporter deferrochelatase/peroxidase subunit [Rarobacter incanus]TQK76606.1 deferrochelatase/peroxidase EfeB [Rarobacter incanus]